MVLPHGGSNPSPGSILKRGIMDVLVTIYHIVITLFCLYMGIRWDTSNNYTLINFLIKYIFIVFFICGLLVTLYSSGFIIKQ